MKKTLFVVASLAILIAVPAASFAQGFLPTTVPGFGWGPGASPGDPVRPLLDPLSFYVGYMWTGKEVLFNLDGRTIPTPIGLEHRWPVSGVWLGAIQKINFNETCGVAVEGWVLIPSTAQGTESSTFSRTTVTVNGTLVTVTTTAGPSGEGWTTKPDWGYVDGRLMCKYGSDFDFFAGFRYDHFSTRFQSPVDAFPLGVSEGQDTADITVNAYIPYVGVQYSSMGSTSSLILRALGFPWFGADVQHFHTGEAGPGLRSEGRSTFNERSYFFEVFGEYSYNVFGGGADIGAFFKWNVLHGYGEINTEIPFVGFNFTDRVVFDRNTITVGGKTSWNFNLPYL
ncbi:MAG: hypothetical protein AB1664_02910 [Thermodesulfobacteriota bacterium]